MKLRIVGGDDRFEVQRKDWFTWHTEWAFGTEAEALAFLDKLERKAKILKTVLHEREIEE